MISFVVRRLCIQMEFSNLVIQDNAYGISAARDWLIFVTVARGIPCVAWNQRSRRLADLWTVARVQTLLIVESSDVITR